MSNARGQLTSAVLVCPWMSLKARAVHMPVMSKVAVKGKSKVWGMLRTTTATAVKKHHQSEN